MGLEEFSYLFLADAPARPSGPRRPQTTNDWEGQLDRGVSDRCQPGLTRGEGAILAEKCPGALQPPDQSLNPVGFHALTAETENWPQLVREVEFSRTN